MGIIFPRHIPWKPVNASVQFKNISILSAIVDNSFKNNLSQHAAVVSPTNSGSTPQKRGLCSLIKLASFSRQHPFFCPCSDAFRNLTYSRYAAVVSPTISRSTPQKRRLRSLINLASFSRQHPFFFPCSNALKNITYPSTPLLCPRPTAEILPRKESCVLLLTHLTQNKN